MRDEVLLALQTPILFLQGTRDPLCPRGDLEAVCARMTAPHELYVVVAGGDHSLQVTAKERKARGETPADVDARILARVGEFLGRRRAPGLP